MSDYSTILERLDDRSVVSFYLNDSKTSMTVLEECDLCFSEQLTKAEAQQLVDELQELVSQMRIEPHE